MAFSSRDTSGPTKPDALSVVARTIKAHAGVLAVVCRLAEFQASAHGTSVFAEFLDEDVSTEALDAFIFLGHKRFGIASPHVGVRAAVRVRLTEATGLIAFDGADSFDRIIRHAQAVCACRLDRVEDVLTTPALCVPCADAFHTEWEAQPVTTHARRRPVIDVGRFVRNARGTLRAVSFYHPTRRTQVMRVTIATSPRVRFALGGCRNGRPIVLLSVFHPVGDGNAARRTRLETGDEGENANTMAIVNFFMESSNFCEKEKSGYIRDYFIVRNA